MNLQVVAATGTGGASGLGAATAKMHASGGAHVTIFDLNDEAGTAATLSSSPTSPTASVPMMPWLTRRPRAAAFALRDGLVFPGTQVAFPSSPGEARETAHLGAGIIANPLDRETIRLDGAIRMGAR